MGHLVSNLRIEKPNSAESELRKLVISTVIRWNDKYGKNLVLIDSCLSYLRSKFKNDVESAEKHFHQEKVKKNRKSQLKEKEKRRNRQHLMDVYRGVVRIPVFVWWRNLDFLDNKVSIATSLQTIETCFNLLVPNIAEETNHTPDPLVMESKKEGMVFPGKWIGGII